MSKNKKDSKPAYEYIHALKFQVEGVDILIEDIRNDADFVSLRIHNHPHFAEVIKFGGHEKGYQYYGPPLMADDDQIDTYDGSEVFGEDINKLVLEYLTDNPLPKDGI